MKHKPFLFMSEGYFVGEAIMHSFLGKLS